jgi:putative membrane protein
MGGMLGCSMGGMWLFGGLSLVVVRGILGTGVWAASRLFQRPSSDAQTLLEQRFARGDVTGEEFEERRGTLEGPR